MQIRYQGLKSAQFADFYRLSPEALKGRGMQRMIVDGKPGVPCRVTLKALSRANAKSRPQIGSAARADIWSYSRPNCIHSCSRRCRISCRCHSAPA